MALVFSSADSAFAQTGATNGARVEMRGMRTLSPGATKNFGAFIGINAATQSATGTGVEAEMTASEAQEDMSTHIGASSTATTSSTWLNLGMSATTSAQAQTEFISLLERLRDTLANLVVSLENLLH